MAEKESIMVKNRFLRFLPTYQETQKIGCGSALGSNKFRHGMVVLYHDYLAISIVIEMIAKFY